MKLTVIKKPIIIPIAESSLIFDGLSEVDNVLRGYDSEINSDTPTQNIPWAVGHIQSGSEMLTEIAGRLCYRAFGDKASGKTNAEYIENLFKHKHLSVLYHAKFSFFFAGISRALSHELIRHYVGADRSEEGNVSQESTRYCKHNGWVIKHPGIRLSDEDFVCDVSDAFHSYEAFIDSELLDYKLEHSGEEAKGLDKKRIYEAAATMLPMCAGTSFVWSANAVALRKMITERKGETANLEFRAFALELERICVGRWPNLFQGL